MSRSGIKSAAVNDAAKSALESLRDSFRSGRSRIRALNLALEAAGDDKTVKAALRRHAALVRRLFRTPARVGNRSESPAAAKAAGGETRRCKLCQRELPHSREDWKHHGKRLLLRKLELYQYSPRKNAPLATYEARFRHVIPALLARRAKNEARWLSEIDPRTIRVLGREQALRQLIERHNATVSRKDHRRKLQLDLTPKPPEKLIGVYPARNRGKYPALITGNPRLADDAQPENPRSSS